MGTEFRSVALTTGETVLVHDQLTEIIRATFPGKSKGTRTAFADRLSVAIHAGGFVLVPLARSNLRASCDIDLYSLALSWKAESERRRKEALDVLFPGDGAQAIDLRQLLGDVRGGLCSIGELREIIDNAVERLNTAAAALGATPPNTTPAPAVARSMPRYERQHVVADWCRRAFGEEQSSSPVQRALRLLEEAIETYQAAGGVVSLARTLVEFVFGRPAGTLNTEIGQVGLTLLALASAARTNADLEETIEIERVLSKPVAHYSARNDAKNAAGFITTGDKP